MKGIVSTWFQTVDSIVVKCYSASKWFSFFQEEFPRGTEIMRVNSNPKDFKKTGKNKDIMQFILMFPRQPEEVSQNRKWLQKRDNM